MEIHRWLAPGSPPPHPHNPPPTHPPPTHTNNPLMRCFHVSFGASMNKLLHKQTSCRLFETPQLPCDVTVMVPVDLNWGGSHKCFCIDSHQIVSFDDIWTRPCQLTESWPLAHTGCAVKRICTRWFVFIDDLFYLFTVGGRLLKDSRTRFHEILEIRRKGRLSY